VHVEDDRARSYIVCDMFGGEKMSKRIRYPEHFNTRREMLWYIKGLMDKKDVLATALQLEINRYRNSLPFTEFKWEKMFFKNQKIRRV